MKHIFLFLFDISSIYELNRKKKTKSLSKTRRNPQKNQYSVAIVWNATEKCVHNLLILSYFFLCSHSRRINIKKNLFSLFGKKYLTFGSWFSINSQMFIFDLILNEIWFKLLSYGWPIIKLCVFLINFYFYHFKNGFISFALTQLVIPHQIKRSSFFTAKTNE